MTTKAPQGFIFADKNNPGVFYFGNICHMRGLEIEGGNPERSYAYSGNPGDTIEVSTVAGVESWEVIDSPKHWFDSCGKEAGDADGGSVTTLCAWAFMPGDCIQDTLQADDTTYPFMRWGAVQVMRRDSDLIYMVPLMECDPYGRVTDPDYPLLKDVLQVGIFIEDTEGQDHLIAYIGNGAWVHRTDLVGLDRDSDRDRIVEPCQQKLSDMLEECK